MKLIGLTGKKGHGKTTARDAIAKFYDNKIVNINFKDALVETMRSKLSRTNVLGDFG